MEESKSRLFMSAIKDLATDSNTSIVNAILEGTEILFESNIRKDKKDFVLGIIEFVNSEGNIDYSGEKSPPPDIKEKIESYGITPDELIEARMAYDKFRKIKSDLY